MYISRIPLDITHRKGVEFVGSSYRIHAAVEAAFDEDSSRVCDQGRILWRVDDAIGRRDCVWLYVISPFPPNCSHIAEQSGMPENAVWESKPYDKVLESVSEGQRWQFRLKGNPVRTALVDKGRIKRQGIKGTRQAYVTNRQQIDWLLQRSRDHGFVVPVTKSGVEAVEVSHRRREQFVRNGQTVTLVTVQFDGVLEVVDAEAFRRTLGFGLGRSKGFGCGLLTIAPIRGDQ